MTRSKIKKNRILITLSLIIVLVMGSADLLFAADNVSMPALTKNSTLTIFTQYTDEDVTKPISGMELEIFKVADLSVDNGVANYTATEEFKSVGIDFNTLTTSSSIDAAEKLAKLVEGGTITGKQGVSNSEGIIKYGTVDHGMYLVVQTGATGDAEEFTKLRPYIVMTPQPMVEVGQSEWQYNVVSIPKMEVLSKVVNLKKKVNDKDRIVVQNPSDKFSYVLLAELSYSPDDFAVVDDVPDQLEIVDKKNIEITVNGKVLEDDVKDSILKIEGNTVRVEPTKAQINEWSPFEMKIMFYCKFREDIEYSEEDLNVTNVAGYEVKGEYVEPKGDENKATVKGEFEDQVKGVGTKTGDDFARYLMILTALMIVSALTILIVMKRRRAKS